MSLNDPLANVLSHILNCEKKNIKRTIIKPVSKLTKKILSILQENYFIGSFEIIENKKGGYIEINLLGNINKCGVIKPRFPVTLDEFEKFEKRYLPAKNIGILIVSTSKGIMTHKEAMKNNVGGKLLAYCY